MRYTPSDCNLVFDYTQPWDVHPWFKPKPGRTKKRRVVEQKFPIFYTHYRIIDFTRFNPPPPPKDKGKKGKGKKKGNKAPEGAAISMPPFVQLEPYELLEDRINPLVSFLFSQKPGGQFIKLTMADPFGIEEVPLPLSFQQAEYWRK